MGFLIEFERERERGGERIESKNDKVNSFIINNHQSLSSRSGLF